MRCWIGEARFDLHIDLNSTIFHCDQNEFCQILSNVGLGYPSYENLPQKISLHHQFLAIKNSRNDRLKYSIKNSYRAIFIYIKNYRLLILTSKEFIFFSRSETGIRQAYFVIKIKYSINAVINQFSFRLKYFFLIF